MSTLPAVRDTGHGATDLTQLVTFDLDNEEYGVDVLKVREIIRMPDITRVPNTPPYVEGVINLRGKVIPIISLRKRFGLMETEYNNRTRIKVMDVEGELMGFVVDAVSEVIRISASEIQPAPSMASGNIDQECIAGVVNHGERLLVVLELERMFSHEERQLLAGYKKAITAVTVDSVVVLEKTSHIDNGVRHERKSSDYETFNTVILAYRCGNHRAGRVGRIIIFCLAKTEG